MTSFIQRHIKRGKSGRKLTRKLDDESMMRGMQRSQSLAHNIKFLNKTQRHELIKRISEEQHSIAQVDSSVVEGAVVETNNQQ